MLYALSLISILGNYGHSLEAQVEAPYRKQGETRQLIMAQMLAMVLPAKRRI